MIKIGIFIEILQWEIEKNIKSNLLRNGPLLEISENENPTKIICFINWNGFRMKGFFSRIQ